MVTSGPAGTPPAFFLGLLYRLRGYGVPVGAQEAVALASALQAGLHNCSPVGYYHVARSLLIHHEGHLDAFDRAFRAEYKGIDDPRLTEQLREWLDQHRLDLDDLDPADLDLLEDLDLDALRELFEDRKREQADRHDGGNRWIGTQGTSPFGQAGRSRAGFTTGSSGGGRAAMHIADARNYAAYRSDVTLDIRQMQIALRRLRAFVREGAPRELDIEATIDETARNAGDITVVTRPPSRPDTHVILMVDVGGSMHPYSQLMSQLFSATKKATHFKELRTYAFHNCVYGRVFATDRLTEPVWVHDLLRQCGPHYKLIMVGDAYMAPYELLQGGNASADSPTLISGLGWLHVLRDHFRRSVWLNPEPTSRWSGTTIEDVGNVFDMYPMTVDGLSSAMARLNR